MSEKLNLAVVGCGRMGQVHSEAYAEMKEEVNVFYVDIDPEKARTYKDRFHGVGTFESLEEALHSPEIDAIDNCLPYHLHVETSEQALAAGKHVLVEKPMATSLAGADRMIHAARQAGKVLMVSENFRFMPHLERAREMIADGVLGDLFLIEVSHFESLRPRRGSIRPTDGMLIDVGHHFVDMAVQLGGPVAWVFAQFSNRTWSEYLGEGIEDTAVVMCGYRSGVTGQLTLSQGAPGAPPKPTFIVCGSKASLYFDWQSGLWSGQGRAWEPTTLVLKKEPEPAGSFEYWAETIRECVRAFVRDLSAGRATQVPGEAGRHDLEIIFAAQESARTRQVVSIPIQ